MKKHVMIYCLLSILLCTGCGQVKDEPVAVQTETNVIIAEESTSETSGTTAPETTTESVSETETQTSEPSIEAIPMTPAITAEEAQKIADEGMEYVRTNNALAIIRNTTYGEVTRLIPDDSISDRSDESLVAWLEKTWEEGKHHNMNDCYPYFLYTTQDAESNFFNFTCQNPVPMTNIEVQNINAILAKAIEYFSDDEDGQSLKGFKFPEIIDGYSFDMVYEDGTIKENMKMYVLKTTASDAYQFDLYYAPYVNAAVGFFALAGMAEQMSEAETTIGID